MSKTRLLDWVVDRVHGIAIREPAGDEGVPPRRISQKLADYFESTEGMISFDEALLLYNLAAEVCRGCIVEVGSYRGRSSVALGRGSLDGAKVPVFAFEPHEEFTGAVGGQFGPKDRAGFYRTMLNTGCYKVVRLVNLSSELVAPNWSREIGLLWIDGDRSYNGVKRDLDCWAPFLTVHSKVVFGGSLDPKDGPRELISELLQSQQFRQVDQVEDLTVLAQLG